MEIPISCLTAREHLVVDFYWRLPKFYGKKFLPPTCSRFSFSGLFADSISKSRWSMKVAQMRRKRKRQASRQVRGRTRISFQKWIHCCCNEISSDVLSLIAASNLLLFLQMSGAEENRCGTSNGTITKRNVKKEVSARKRGRAREEKKERERKKKLILAYEP